MPALHSAALELLARLFASARTAALHLYIPAAELLGDCMGRVASAVGGSGEGEGGADAAPPPASAAAAATLAAWRSAAVRARLYDCSRLLLHVSGVGVVRTLGTPLLDAAVLEVYGRQAQHAQRAAHRAELLASMGPPPKKARKGRGEGCGEAAGAPAIDDVGSAGALRDLPAQAAALRAVEALLTVGGCMLGPSDRMRGDALAAHAAETALSAVRQLWASEGAVMAAWAAAAGADGGATTTDLLAAVARAANAALLASVLAPGQYQAPYLPLALRVWRAGAAGRDAELAEQCNHVSHP